MVLSACGATVITCSDMIKVKGRITIDCCLFASNTLPPHVITVPEYVSKLMQSISNNVPLLDLAWAHQSIIQRRRLPLIGDIISRYVINLGHTMSNTCYVSSIKSKAGGVRYVDMGEASCVCFVCSSIPTCVGNRLSSAQQYLARGCVRFK